MNAAAPPVSRTSAEASAHCRKQYLDLMQNCLLGLIYRDPAQDSWSRGFDLQKRILGREHERQIFLTCRFGRGGTALDEIFRTPRAVDSMNVVLTKRELTPAERENALAWQRGAMKSEVRL